jgi:acetyl esterase/lipase
MKRSVVAKLLGSIGLALCASLGWAQMPNASDFAMTPIAAPSQPDAIDLYPGVAPGSENATQKEQWESLPHDRVVRNVTHPTLTPILPAKKKATGTAVIVAPGGGFVLLSMDNEGYKVAHWLADHGIAAFVLKYRVNPTPASEAEFAAFGQRMFLPPPGGKERPPLPHSDLAVADGQQALRLVRQRAAQWGIDPKRVGMVGFSAGAMNVLQVALKNAADARPDFIAPVYGPMSSVTVPANAPPLFVARAADDPLMALEDFGLVTAWRQAGAPVELHMYEHGGHGFGASHKGTTSDLWLDEFYAWLKDRGALSATH